jgi:hypothetical protein
VAATGDDGYYTFSGLLPGSYMLTPTKTGYSFHLPEREVTLGPDADAVDFTALRNIYLPLVWN